MSETEWMYDSLTERFGESLGERQKVVDALLIAKAIVGPGPLGGTNSDSLLAVARFILDEWGKCEDAEDEEDEASDQEVSGAPHVLDVGMISAYDIELLRSGDYTFPEGSRWTNNYGAPLIFTDGDFWLVRTKNRASTDPKYFPFTRIKGDN